MELIATLLSQQHLLTSTSCSYFHSLEATAPLPTRLSCERRVLAPVQKPSDAERDDLLARYYSCSHHHYPVIMHDDLGEVSFAGGDYTHTSLQSAIILLMCALGEYALVG